MQFTLFTTLLLATLSLASPAPKKEQKGFEVVIHYVDAPDCDYQCGVNTTLPYPTETTTTITSTNTKYVVLTLQTAAGTTSTLGCETGTTIPADYSTSAPAAYETSTTAAAEPTY